MRLTREYVLLISNLLLQVSCKMLFFRRGNDELPRSARAASPGATAPYRSRRPDRHCAGARYRVPAGPYLEFPARAALAFPAGARSEEHTSELQSLRHLVCRLLLE